MKKYKLKKSVKRKIILFVILFILIFGGIKVYNIYVYRNSNEYKLITVGYSKSDSLLIIDKLNNEYQNYLINNEYNSDVISLINEKYFISDYFYTYLDYNKNNSDKSIGDVISIVNVSSNNEWYDKNVISKTDTSKLNLMLVNKFNYLDEDYDPSVVSISNSYCYGSQYALVEVRDAYEMMANDASEDGINLIVNSSYRTYEEQDDIYKEYYMSKGIGYADNYAARAGYSEHQTGLALDIFSTDSLTMEDFSSSKAYTWLINNSYKYGFILRYPKDKEYLTGYNYESWHYRYVGKDIAKKVYDEGITYDEYYAYYLR